MVIWFRPPLRMVVFDAWICMWAWIGTAHAENWYGR